MVTDQKMIEKEVLEFYKRLVGTSATNIDGVDIPALRGGNQLSEEQRRGLNRPVTEEEIMQALKGFGDNKAPGWDGFNAKFFKSTWSITGHDVKKVIYDFFVHNNLSLNFNTTLVTLSQRRLML